MFSSFLLSFLFIILPSFSRPEIAVRILAITPRIIDGLRQYSSTIPTLRYLLRDANKITTRKRLLSPLMHSYTNNRDCYLWLKELNSLFITIFNKWASKSDAFFKTSRSPDHTKTIRSLLQWLVV